MDNYPCDSASHIMLRKPTVAVLPGLYAIVDQADHLLPDTSSTGGNIFHLILTPWHSPILYSKLLLAIARFSYNRGIKLSYIISITLSRYK